MIQFTIETITLDEFKNQILDDFYNFEKMNTQSTMVESYAENLTPYLFSIIQTTLQNQSEQVIIEDLINFKVKYRETIQKHFDHLISIHLFSFTLLNKLENEAEVLNNEFLRNLWSETADEIAEISLNVNETTSS